MRVATYLTILALISSGAVAGRAPAKRWIDTSDCIEMCEVIESCASKVERPELGKMLCHVAACESGRLCGKKEVRSPSGKYLGPYQFGRPTWNKVCKPIFKEKKIDGCAGKKAIFDRCCTTMCAAEIIARKVNVASITGQSAVPPPSAPPPLNDSPSPFGVFHCCSPW